MRQGITTKYHGPTNSAGARVKALARKGRTWSDGSRDKEMSLTDHWDHGSNIDANHTRVARLLAVTLEWSGLWVGAGAPDESGYHYVCLGDVTPGRIGDAGLAELGRQNIDWFHVEAKPRGPAA